MQYRPQKTSVSAPPQMKPKKGEASWSLQYTNEELKRVRQTNSTDDDDDDDDDKNDDKNDDKDEDKDDEDKDKKDRNDKDKNDKDEDEKDKDDKDKDKDDDDDEKDGDSSDNQGSDPDSVTTQGTAGRDDVCFPGSVTVLLDNGVRKLMSDLAVGDRVQVGPNQFSEVFMFTHKMADVKYDFITLRTTAGPSISLTAKHYIHSNGALVAAATVTVGDTVELGDGSVSRVADITISRRTGLYNPQTVHGDIVVDGVRASTYTASVHPKAAHALLAPLRALFPSFRVGDEGCRIWRWKFHAVLPEGWYS